MSAPASRNAIAPTPEREQRDRALARLLAAAAQGDCQAFEDFYDASVAYARALARRMLSGTEVDDLLSDVYFEAWRNAARFDAGRGSAMTWLLTLVRSRALDLLRHRAAQPGASGSETLSDTPADAGDDPAERLWRLQAGTRLHQALRVLSAAERWVLGLAYFRELSHSEIAQCTGLPLGTVKSHLQRAQAKLRAVLTA